METDIKNLYLDRQKYFFGKLLNISKKFGITSRQIAEELSYSYEHFNRMVHGRVIADEKIIFQFIEFLPISPSEKHDLSNEFLNYKITSEEKIKAQVIDSQFSVSSIEKTINELKTTLSEQTQQPQIQKLVEEFNFLKTTITDMGKTSQKLTAPVTIPSAKAMTIPLVPITQLDRLEEYRAEENTQSSYFGIFLGAVFGVLINVATGGKFEIEALVILAVVIACGVIFFLKARELKGKADKLKEKMLEDQVTIEAYTEIK